MPSLDQLVDKSLHAPHDICFGSYGTSRLFYIPNSNSVMYSNLSSFQVMPDFHARSHPVDIINFYLNHILVLCIPIYILSHFNIEVHVFDLNHLLVTLSTFLSLSLVSVTAAFAAKTNINFRYLSFTSALIKNTFFNYYYEDTILLYLLYFSMCPGAVDKLWPFGGHLWRFKCILAFITIWFPLVNICVKTTLLKMI